jgi:40S ribosomal protein S4 C-terminus
MLTPPSGFVWQLLGYRMHPTRVLIGYAIPTAGQEFATRMHNVFLIGRGDKPLISLPKGKGLRCGRHCTCACRLPPATCLRTWPRGSSLYIFLLVPQARDYC